MRERTISVVWIFITLVIILLGILYSPPLALLISLGFLIITYYASGAAYAGPSNPYIRMARSQYHDDIEVRHYMQEQKMIAGKTSSATEINKIMLICGLLALIVNLLLILIPA